jgi:hypothetical protein
MADYKGDFLWPHEDGSIEEAGYEFLNARTEEFRKKWWEILLDRTTGVGTESMQKAGIELDKDLKQETIGGFPADDSNEE